MFSIFSFFISMRAKGMKTNKSMSDAHSIWPLTVFIFLNMQTTDQPRLFLSCLYMGWVVEACSCETSEIFV